MMGGLDGAGKLDKLRNFTFEHQAYILAMALARIHMSDQAQRPITRKERSSHNSIQLEEWSGCNKEVLGHPSLMRSVHFTSK